MSLRSPLVYLIPAETARVARAALPADDPYLLLADELGVLYANPQFARLFSFTGQPALDPARLAAITIFQFMEGLSDAQAAAAVARNIGWKYALALDLTAPGFDPSVLCEFRARLLAGGLETLLLDTLLERLRERGLLRARGRARTDSTRVLAAVRTVSRLVTLGETLRAALNALAGVAPAWLATVAPREWYDRYSHRVDEYRLPKEAAARAAWAASVGGDGQQLLSACYAADAPRGVWQLDAVQVLRQVWLQQFYAPDADGIRHWREAKDQPPSGHLILSPYDPEAHRCTHGEVSWVGYKTHLTETCDADLPHLITHSETTLATTTDEQVLEPIHAALAEHKLLPAEHLVDAGYVDSARLVGSAQKYGVRLVGPAPADTSWQGRAKAGYALGDFAIDWAGRQVTCPQGRQSVKWSETQDQQGQAIINIRFSKKACGACPVRERCTHSGQEGRNLTLRPRTQHEALQAARQRQETAEFKAEYAARAGMEGTISQGVRLGELRQTRYRGVAKTRLQQIITAVALNLVRLVAWWRGEPRRGTRISAFAALAGQVPLAGGIGQP